MGLKVLEERLRKIRTDKRCYGGVDLLVCLSDNGGSCNVTLRGVNIHNKSLLLGEGSAATLEEAIERALRDV